MISNILSLDISSTIGSVVIGSAACSSEVIGKSDSLVDTKKMYKYTKMYEFNYEIPKVSCGCKK